MDLEMKDLLESQCLQVIEGAWDFKFKTKTFIRHPDGHLNPYYDYLYEIPMLPNGQEFDLDKNAMPGSSSVKDAGAITHSEYGLDAQGLVIPIIVGYILLAVVILAIVICIYYILHPPAQQPPCGTTAQTIDVSECAKIIIMPNCDSRLYDSCQDEWLEEGWHTWEPPANWGTWLVLGIVGIGAIILIPQILKIVKPEKPYYPAPPRKE